jgi:hypothetical protein
MINNKSMILKLPEEINRFIDIYKVVYRHKTKADAVIAILKEYFKDYENLEKLHIKK